MAIDLYDLTNLMASREIRAKHRTDIVKFYFNEFSITLKKLGYRNKAPTLLDLNIELLRCSVIDLLHSFAFMTIQFVETKVIDFNTGDLSSVIADLTEQSIQTKEFQEHIKETLKRMVAQGTLDLESKIYWSHKITVILVIIIKKSWKCELVLRLNRLLSSITLKLSTSLMFCSTLSSIMDESRVRHG